MTTPQAIQAEPIVTVIIPAYNAGDTLAATLNSVCRQTHRALDIIVVDDGSTDDTLEIARRVAAEDGRVRIFRQANAGVAAARNLALAEATGEFVGPLDADDLWHPRKIELQLAHFREGSARLGLVYAWSACIDEEDRLIPGEECRSDHAGDVQAPLTLGNFVGNASAPLIRTACLREVGGYDISLRARGAQGCEDHQLYLALAERYDFDVVPAHLIGYRQRPDSMSRSVETMLRSHRFVLEEWRQRRPELPAALFRWSEWWFRIWLARRALREERDIATFVRYLAGAFLRDPSLPWEPWFCRRMFRCLTRYVAGVLRIADRPRNGAIYPVKTWRELIELSVVLRPPARSAADGPAPTSRRSRTRDSGAEAELSPLS